MIDVLLWMLFAAALVPAHQYAFRRGGVALLALVLADAVALTLVAIPGTSERAWERTAQEDGVIEWATTFAFLTAAFLFAKRPRTVPLELVGRVGLVLFCIFVAGEEISWGQRLLSFQPPEIFLEKNFQQETNLHNVLMDESSGLPFEVDSKHLVMLIAIGYGILGPLLVRLRPLRLFEHLAPPLSLMPMFLAVVVVEQVYPVDLTGEGAELFLGLLFAMSAAVDRGERAVAGALFAPLVLGALVAPLLAFIVFGDDEVGTAQARAELALLGDDLSNGAGPKLDKKSSIHKRVFTAVRDGYFEIDGGAFHEGQKGRRDRVGFFLDPWNNPYWVRFEKKSGAGIVYSFGPNRQRDTDVKDADQAGGDDVLVKFKRAED